MAFQMIQVIFGLVPLGDVPRTVLHMLLWSWGHGQEPGPTVARTGAEHTGLPRHGLISARAIETEPDGWNIFIGSMFISAGKHQHN